MRSGENKVIRGGQFSLEGEPNGEGLRSKWQGDGTVTEAEVGRPSVR